MSIGSPRLVFAGLDGGASKTKVRVVDDGGRLIGEGLAGPGSLTLSPEMAAENCRQALQAALAGSGLALGGCRVVCGVAGQRQTARRLLFERRLGDAGFLEVISDGYAALLGAHRGAPGAVVITGTGSVGLSLDDDGKTRQVGGFGPIVGDEGGGNWLGREAVRRVLRALDDAAAGVGPISPLATSLVKLMGGCHEAILHWIAAADATKFAELAPLIIRHDETGDPIARELLREATLEVRRLIELAGGHGTLPVAVLGGLAGTLLSRLPSAVRSSVVSPASDPMEGALLRARELAPAEQYVS